MILLEVASAGTVTMSWVAVAAETAALTPLNFTMLSEGSVLKFVPVIVTSVPYAPDCGEKPVMVVCNTVKSADEVAVLPFRATLIFPVVADSGTVTTNSVAVALDTAAATPLNFTTFSEPVVLKFVPVIVTVAPGKPESGEKLVMVVCNTVKSVAEVAVFPFTVTVIFPVVADSGTVTSNSVAVALDTVAATPLNFTTFSASVALKFVPVMVTAAPGKPESGEKPVSVVCNTVKSVDEVAVFPLTVTVIFPVVAASGTVTTNCVAVALATVASTPLNET